MLVFFLIIGGLIYLATVYIKQKHGTFDNFMESLKDTSEEDGSVGYGEETPPDQESRIAPSPEEPDTDTETVPQPTQEQLSKWRELEEMCKPGGLRSMYTGFKVDDETGDFVPAYENVDCCFEQPWKNEGDCGDGQQKQIRGILNEDLCDVEPEKEQMVDCCSYGEWENDGECTDGVQKQNRQIFNPNLCIDTTTTREIDCCSYGEWEFDGECVDGNQNYTRTITNSELCEDTSLVKTEKCCLPLEWVNVGECKVTGMQTQQRAHLNRDLCTGDDYEDVREVPCCFRDDWKDVGLCNFSEGKLQQTRTIENADICRTEDAGAATTQTIDCCYIGPWENDGPGDEESGVQKQGRTLKNEETCPFDTKPTREVPGCKRGPWLPDPTFNNGVCNPNGQIRVKRDIELFDTCRNNDVDDPENATKKMDNCCYKGKWTPSGECVDGKQKLIRTILNIDTCIDDDGDVDGINTDKQVDCCGFTSNWEADKSIQTADETQNYCKPEGMRTEKRTLLNRNLCDSEGKAFLLTQPTSREVDCCYVSDFEEVTEEGEKEYAVDKMPYLKYILNHGVEKGKFTQKKLDNFKEENIKKCGPGGEVKFGRTVHNPEICKAEVEDEIRENDDNDFTDTYTEPCCFIEPDWVPVIDEKCTKRRAIYYRGEPPAYYQTSRAKHGDLCFADAWMFWKTFTTNDGSDPPDKVSFDHIGGREHRKIDNDSAANGIKFLSYLNSKNKVVPAYNARGYTECFEDGTMTDSDYNWKDFTKYKGMYQTSRWGKTEKITK